MKNNTLSVLAILMWFMVQPTNVGKGQATGQPVQSASDIPELIERGERLSAIDSMQNIEFVKLARRKPVKLKEYQPAAARSPVPAKEHIYFRRGGDIVFDRLYTRDGGFLIIDLDTILPKIEIVRDTFVKVEYRQAPVPQNEQKFFAWVKNIFKSKKKHKQHE